MKKTLLLALIVLTSISFSFSQGFTPPSEGKAVVYFVRVTKYGKPTAFEFFHQDKYIGYLKGYQYMRYECDPGTHLFWASTENKEFITADLEAGKSYIVMVNVIMGAMKARVGLAPLNFEDEDVWARVKKLVNKDEPFVTPDAKIEKINDKLSKKFIPEQLERYENEWKGEKNFRHIDQPIPEDKL